MKKGEKELAVPLHTGRLGSEKKSAPEEDERRKI
jgi:hypothetical protein